MLCGSIDGSFIHSLFPETVNHLLTLDQNPTHFIPERIIINKIHQGIRRVNAIPLYINAAKWELKITGIKNFGALGGIYGPKRFLLFDAANC